MAAASSRKGRRRRSSPIRRCRRSISGAAMADATRTRPPAAAPPILQVKGLNVYYGHSHALQGVDITLDHGVLSVVGRNGMGKTTLCNTITGLKRAASGSIRFNGREISGLEPHEIHRFGI